MVQTETVALAAPDLPQALPVPVVDLSQSEHLAAASVREACEEHGFLYGMLPLFLICQPQDQLVTPEGPHSAVTNHGVPDSVIEDQFLASREFFGCPEAVKLAVEVCLLSIGSLCLRAHMPCYVHLCCAAG